MEKPSLPEKPYAGESYYGRPALKPSPFGWSVAAYIFTAGLAGAAQIIATLLDFFGPPSARRVVRRGRQIALGGTVIGPLLLIYDLHTPQRWFNMLRIFRKTSPMSIGTYVLSIFGLFSAVTAAAQLLADRGGRRRGSILGGVARVAQVPAALAGAGMTTYTASLLAATSTPLWAAAPRLLAIRFASSAMATGAAVLSLCAGRRREAAETGRALDTLAMAATGIELAAGMLADRAYRARGVDQPLRSLPWGPVHRVGVMALGGAVPLALYATRRRRGASPLPALAILAGGMLMRGVILNAGNRSAKRPTDYFRMAQQPDGGGGWRR